MPGGPRKLTESQVQDIFTRTRTLQFHCSRRFHARLSRELAARFSVNVKTIRDVSNRRSWARITHELSTSLVDDLLSRSCAMQGDDPFADGMAEMYAPYGCEDPF